MSWLEAARFSAAGWTAAAAGESAAVAAGSEEVAVHWAVTVDQRAALLLLSGVADLAVVAVQVTE